MSARTRMRGRMPRRRTVTAQGAAAGLAGSQMHPSAAHLLALFADVALRMPDLVDRREVRTSFAGHCLSLLEPAAIRRAPDARTKSLSSLRRRPRRRA